MTYRRKVDECNVTFKEYHRGMMYGIVWYCSSYDNSVSDRKKVLYLVRNNMSRLKEYWFRIVEGIDY